jgi:hypothetical protein
VHVLTNHKLDTNEMHYIFPLLILLPLRMFQPFSAQQEYTPHHWTLQHKQDLFYLTDTYIYTEPTSNNKLMVEDTS